MTETIAQDFTQTLTWPYWNVQPGLHACAVVGEFPDSSVYSYLSAKS